MFQMSLQKKFFKKTVCTKLSKIAFANDDY